MMTKEDYLNEYKTHKSMRDNVKRDDYRLQYHLMPPTGFLNDPNGLFQKDGVYHIYFQYTPFTAGWGTKLWGHYTSKDMINFNQEEPFLYPDISLDRDGVYMAPLRILFVDDLAKGIPVDALEGFGQLLTEHITADTSGDAAHDRAGRCTNARDC